MTANLSTLPATGRFIVDTDRDTYDVDLDARVVVYLDLDREGRGEHVDPAVFWFDTVEGRVGSVLRFDTDGAEPRTSALVLGITPAPVEVSA